MEMILLAIWISLILSIVFFYFYNNFFYKKYTDKITDILITSWFNIKNIDLFLKKIEFDSMNDKSFVYLKSNDSFFFNSNLFYWNDESLIKSVIDCYLHFQYNSLSDNDKNSYLTKYYMDIRKYSVLIDVCRKEQLIDFLDDDTLNKNIYVSCRKKELWLLY